MKIIILSSIIFALTIINSQSCYGLRILGLFPVPSKSHFIMFEALMKGLARKGHQVDVISTYPLQKPYPNYTDIIHLPLTMASFVNSLKYETFNHMSDNIIEFLALIAGNEVCVNLGNPEMLKFYRDPPRDPPYDLFITEFFASSCYLVVGHHLKIPTVTVSSALLYPWLNNAVANPQNLAFMPNNFLGYRPPFTFWQRFWNTVYSGLNIRYFQYLTRVQDDIVKKHFGDDAPSIRELENRTALVLMNTHISLNGGRPITSAVVEVGGLHIQDHVEELPKDLKRWMDDSKEGFIYFSFGSMVTIESFPTEILQQIYRSLRKISPIRVLMKIPDPTKLPPGLPENTRTVPWAPQFHVLNHKNIKGFITHGGLMGTQEAIYCGVPMIGVPLFIDQFTNVELYVSKKIAVKVDRREMTEKNLDYALNEILYNPIYKKNCMDISAKFRDRPMSPMDTATWWIEYIARHGSSQPLRSPAMDLTWWQIDLLDVYLFLLLLAIITTYLMVLLFRYIVQLFITMTASKLNRAKKVN